MSTTTDSLSAAARSAAEVLRHLVGFDSTSRNSNLPIAEWIEAHLDRPGVSVTRNPSPDGEKTNLVVHVGPPVDPESRAGLTLSGHMDVVPAEEPDWRSDPFVLRETDDAFYGRGACDMKGFVALAVDLAARIDPASLRHPLVLVLTYDEELGTLGARHFAKTWRGALPRAAIIGEPTSLAAVRLHKGHAKCRLTLRGVGAHSGYPHLGKSAIEPAGKAIQALAGLRRELESEGGPHAEHFGAVPFVALNMARIRGGTAINIVPDLCEIDLGFRLLPGMTSAPMVERLRSVLDAALEGDDFTFEFLDESPPLEVQESAPIHGAVCELIGQTETVAVSYATDGGWLSTLGLDCLIWGPGTIEVAHKPNEVLPKDEFDRAAGLLGTLVERFCR